MQCWHMHMWWAGVVSKHAVLSTSTCMQSLALFPGPAQLSVALGMRLCTSALSACVHAITLIESSHQWHISIAFCIRYVSNVSDALFLCFVSLLFCVEFLLLIFAHCKSTRPTGLPSGKSTNELHDFYDLYWPLHDLSIFSRLMRNMSRRWDVLVVVKVLSAISPTLMLTDTPAKTCQMTWTGEEWGLLPV